VVAQAAVYLGSFQSTRQIPEQPKIYKALLFPLDLKRKWEGANDSPDVQATFSM
jgi:hypothetical protein